MVHTLSKVALAVCAASLLAPWASAAGASEPVEAAPAPEREGLTLSGAMREASERNYSILLEELDRDAAVEAAGQARAPYTPVLVIDADAFDRAAVGSLPDRGGLDLEAQVRWGTPWGSAISAGGRASAPLGGALSPHGASLFVTAAQSLLRGGWRAGAWAPALEADLGAEIQRQRFRDGLNALLVDVEEAYWELAFAQADLEGRRRSLKRAEAQFDDTRQNIARGLLAEADVYIVEENVVIFQEQVVRSTEALTLARARLLRLLQREPSQPLSAVDDLDGAALSLPDADQAAAAALAQNPALEASRLSAEQAQVRLLFDENQALPLLDLDASLILNGAGEGLADALASAASAEGPEVRVGLRFEVPLLDGATEAGLARSRIERRRALIALKDDEARLRFEVQELLVRLEAQADRVALGQRRVELAGLKLEAQVERYKSGISTLDEVVRFQRDLDGALIAARRVRVEWLVTRSRLARAQGTLHRDHGVEVR